VSANGKGTFLGHPKGLFVLFFTEMWERFSYYGMRALLLPYMVNYFKWTQQDASFYYKWYTALVYLTPLLGGFLADRYLGNKRAIIIGATLMAIGHFCMAFEQYSIFLAALIFLIAGNGFFKPNMSTQVGRLYPPNDDRRDAAYTIFYMGINLGAFFSPLLCGWLQENTKWGYHAGFTAAGVGMVLGLVIYLLFISRVEEIPATAAPVSKDNGTTRGGFFCPTCGAAMNDLETDRPIHCAQCGSVTTIPPRKQAEKSRTSASDSQHHYVSETEAAVTPSVVSWLSSSSPTIMVAFGVIIPLLSLALWLLGRTSPNNALAFGLGGGAGSFMGAYVLSRITMALRDRVLAIYIVAIFVVFFWAAFEQAGNAMNVYADKTTNRYITQESPAPSVYPESIGDNGTSGSGESRTLWQQWVRLWNPVPTAWYQSINALAIFTLAPIAAWLWVYLPRRGFHLSIPMKIAIGVFLQGMAFALMIWSVRFENQPSQTSLIALPSGVAPDSMGRVVFRNVPDLSDDAGFEAFQSPELSVEREGREPGVVHGGRITYDSVGKKLLITGVLSDTDRDRLLWATVSRSYLSDIRQLAEESTKARTEKRADLRVSVELTEVPEGFDLRYSGFKEEEVVFDLATKRLSTTKELADRDYKLLLQAGADRGFRDALNRLYVDSAKYKVSSWWLVWFYVLCTLGELCLSPVGLSMVSKLAPVRYGTMMMGVWLLTSFFGNFTAGLLGESWGTVHPTTYFAAITAAMIGASFICFLLVRKIQAMMHGVN